MDRRPDPEGAGGGAVRAIGQVRQTTALLRAAARVVDDLEPESAVALAGPLAQAERVAAAALLRATRRAGDEGARKAAGRRDAASLLSELRGSSVGKAKAGIEATERIQAAPVVGRAFDDGTLSLDQAVAIAPAAAAAPDKAQALVETAKGSSLRTARAEADRVLRQARSEDDEVERERKVRARRYCKVWAPEGGGVRLDALLTATAGARLQAALDKEADALADEAHAPGVGQPRERLRADALVRLISGHAKTAGAHFSVRVDAGALVRGSLEEGEVCEIPGVGPVSVGTARSLLGEAFLTFLVRDAMDIKTVTSTSRVVPRRVAVALEERDRACVVPGCGATANLELHHWRLDFSRNGPTELDNLCRICAVHHSMITKDGWQLGGGPGEWRLSPPRPRGRPRAAPTSPTTTRASPGPATSARPARPPTPVHCT